MRLLLYVSCLRAGAIQVLRIVRSIVPPATSVGIQLALQLHFCFEMGAACFGLVSSSPE